MTIKADNNDEKNRYFHILARGIIIDGDCILAAKTNRGNHTLLPGGHLEYNEDLKNTLKREILEEIGMDCTVGDYVGCLEAKWIDDEKTNQEINHIFIVNGINKNMEIIPKEAHLEFHWVKISEKDMENKNLLPCSMRKIILNVYNKDSELNYYSEI